jgi:hypothetical protein
MLRNTGARKKPAWRAIPQICSRSLKYTLATDSINDKPSVNIKSSTNRIGKYTMVHGGTKLNNTTKTPNAHRSNNIMMNDVIFADIGRISLGK